jgi:hypothetical protein
MTSCSLVDGIQTTWYHITQQPNLEYLTPSEAKIPKVYYRMENFVLYNFIEEITAFAYWLNPENSSWTNNYVKWYSKMGNPWKKTCGDTHITALSCGSVTQAALSCDPSNSPTVYLQPWLRYTSNTFWGTVKTAHSAPTSESHYASHAYQISQLTNGKAD